MESRITRFFFGYVNKKVQTDIAKLSSECAKKEKKTQKSNEVDVYNQRQDDNDNGFYSRYCDKISIITITNNAAKPAATE